MAIRKEVHTRCAIASKHFNEWSAKLAAWTKCNGSIQGDNPQLYLNKLNKANRIWFHYSKEFGNNL